MAVHRAESASRLPPNDEPTFPKSRDAVESRPAGITVFQARDALTRSSQGTLRDSSESSQQQPAKVVCYYGAWAVYRKKPMAFNVTDIDPFACTHLIYSFAGLDKTKFVIKSLDPEVDIDEGLRRLLHS